MDWASFAPTAFFLGLGWWLAFRAVAGSKGPDYYAGPCVWEKPPRWMRAIIGGRHGRIRLDSLTFQAAGIVWTVAGAIAWIAQPEATSAVFLALLLSWLLSLPVMVVVAAAVMVERGGRLE